VKIYFEIKVQKIKPQKAEKKEEEKKKEWVLVYYNYVSSNGKFLPDIGS
jgi:predicted ribosome quality control (RQC) complex YloA/Tae2 family protein